jgi:hypothetical protein
MLVAPTGRNEVLGAQRRARWEAQAAYAAQPWVDVVCA